MTFSACMASPSPASRENGKFDMTPKRERLRSGPSFVSTFAAVMLAIVGLFLADTFLEKIERSESHVEAVRFYANGQRLMEQGKSAEAVDQFRSAISVERNNEDYQLALGQALLAAGRLQDAETTLDDLLQRNPFGGPANLVLARVLIQENKIDEGISYYHRAIYGQWKEDPQANQVKARFELTDLLSHQNSKEALLAELLPLQGDAPDDIATKKKLGRLFIAAGSPARATEIFRDILRAQPQDPDAYAGLGEADFARGNYRTAQTEFLSALRLRPADRETQQRLALCNRVLELDPTGRGLGRAEQYRRSRQLVDLVLDDLDRCLGSAAPAAAQDLIKAVQDALKKPVTAARRNAAFEQNLTWADQLWQVRKTDCKPAAGSEEPLTLVLAMLAR
jgi:tetratricopeptide (TPR) repeat protein